MVDELSNIVRISPLLSMAENPHLSCKLESSQISGSFKMRGAVEVLKELEKTRDERRVITISMGNTAFSLAWAGRLLGRKVTVVMPETVSPKKLALCREIGPEIILRGQTGSEAIAHCLDIVSNGDYYFLHPHKCPPFLRGSEQIFEEIVEHRPDVERIFVPIGGGGLLSAIIAAKEKSGRDIEIVGVEAVRSPAFALSLEEGKPVRIECTDSIAEGLTINEPDEEVFSYIAPRVSRIVTVEETEIIDAMRQLMDDLHVITEPSGAANLAAMNKVDDGKNAAAIISGGNVSLEYFSELVG